MNKFINVFSNVKDYLKITFNFNFYLKKLLVGILLFLIILYNSNLNAIGVVYLILNTLLFPITMLIAAGIFKIIIDGYSISIKNFDILTLLFMIIVAIILIIFLYLYSLFLAPLVLVVIDKYIIVHKRSKNNHI